MTVNEIRKVAVIGSGTMGNGIAQVFATHGYEVVLIDIKQDFLDRAIDTITKSLDRFVKKEAITEEDKSAAMGRIVGSTSLDSVQRSQLVIEAIIEDLPTNWRCFGSSRILSAGGDPGIEYLSLPITQLAAAPSAPTKFIGMHFMNPVPMMKLIELIRGIATSDETFDAHRGAGEEAGEDAGRSQRLSGVYRQSHPDADDQRSDLRPHGRCRDGRGDRRSDEAGHGAPDGSADAGGFHRTGCLSGDS